MTSTLYIVIGPGRWGYPRIVRTTKKKPAITDEQLCFKLEIEIPDEILSPPVIPVKIEDKNIIRSIPKIT